MLVLLEVEVLLVFCAASIALGITPGPDNIFVLTQSALYGRFAGLAVTLGLCTGLLVHTTAVTFGMAAIFAASPIAFNVVKIIGAAYLVYLAWQALKASKSHLSANDGAKPSFTELYGRGVVMNITNPKVGIFFLAFLPQFADPQAGALVPQMLALSFLFIGATIIVFGLVAWGAGFLGDRLKKSPAIQLMLNRIAAVVFLGLAMRLLATER